MFVCPVCGYDKLIEKPYNSYGCASFEICSCCGFEFGFDDVDQGFTFEEYRNKWVTQQFPWFSPQEKPENWNLLEQLKNIRK